MKRFLFVLLSILVSFVCGSQSVSDKRAVAESLYNQAKQIGEKETVGRYVTEEAMRRIIGKYKEASCQDNAIMTSWINQAIGYCTLKDYKNSLAVLDSAAIYATLDDDRTEIDLYRGYILEDSGNGKEAGVYYKRALRSISKNSSKSMPVIIKHWEILLAAKGLDKATDYLSKELEGMDIDSKEKAVYSKLLDNSVAHVKGRQFYIHSRASGLYVVSKKQMDELRFAYDTCKSFTEECLKDNPDFECFVGKGQIATLSQEEQREMRSIVADLKNCPGSIDITVMDKPGWYKVAFYSDDYKHELLVNLTSANGKLAIDAIDIVRP